jgi:hypothetical protein
MPRRCADCGSPAQPRTRRLLPSGCWKSPYLVEIFSERSSKIRHFLDGAGCTAPTPSTALRITHHARGTTATASSVDFSLRGSAGRGC